MNENSTEENMTNAAIQIITPHTITRAAQPQKAKHGDGSVTWRRGKAIVRLSLGSLGRHLFTLTACTTEREAEERRAVMAEMARELCDTGQIGAGLPLLQRAAEASDAKVLQALVGLARKVARGEAMMKPGSTTTIRELGERWTSGALARLHPAHVKVKVNAAEDAACFERYVYPVAGDLPVASFTLDHADQIMARIPSDRAQNTRRNIAVKLHRLLAYAVYPLRLLAANPLPKGFLPKPGAQKAKVYLYPDEDRVLLANVDIPLVRRVFYGFLAREGMRESEALALRWTDLDLDKGAVKLDTNKTDDARTWALDPGVCRALVAWRAIRGREEKLKALVFQGLSLSRAAEVFRTDLRLCGVTRPELYETSKNRQPIRVHDLRATFVSLSLANNRTEGWIMDRTGHKSSQMIARYRRGARTAAELHLGALAPMDDAIPELRPSPREPGSGRDEGAAGRPAEDADGGPPGEASGRPGRIQSLDPQIGTAAPKVVPNGREPSGEIQIPAGIATSRDAPGVHWPLQNRTTRVRIPSSPPIANPAESQKKAAKVASDAGTENVRADPIWIQSAATVAALGGSSAAPADVEPGASGPAVEPPAAAPGALPAPARVAMVRALADGMAESFAAGDLEAVRLALDAIGRLVGR